MPSTMEDFWRMVTEHNICTMVQLNSPSVVSYWDESDNAGSQISFGSLQVTLKTKETMPSYIKREFVVYNTKVEEEVCIRDLYLATVSVTYKIHFLVPKFGLGPFAKSNCQTESKY